MFIPAPSQSTTDPCNPPSQSLQPTFSNGKNSPETESLEGSFYHSFHSREERGGRIRSEEDGSVFDDNSHLNGHEGVGGTACETALDSGKEASHDDKEVVGHSTAGSEGPEDYEVQQDPALCSGAFDNPEESPLIPMTLYLHRVKSLVLALLVEPQFLSDTTSMEEVVRTRRTYFSKIKFLVIFLHYHVFGTAMSPFLIPLSLEFESKTAQQSQFSWCISK